MLKLSEDEDIILEIHPSFKPAYLKAVMGALLLIFSAYLHKPTNEIYKNIGFISYLSGAILVMLALSEIAVNKRTSYLITNLRVIKKYKSPIQLKIKEIPINKIRSVEIMRDFWEGVLKLGHVIVASGTGKQFNIKMKT